MKLIDTTKSQILKIDNAFLLRKRELLDEKDRLVETAYPFDTDGDEREAFCQLVRALAEYYGFMEDTYGNHNLEINFNRKGRKVEK